MQDLEMFQSHPIAKHYQICPSKPYFGQVLDSTWAMQILDHFLDLFLWSYAYFYNSTNENNPCQMRLGFWKSSSSHRPAYSTHFYYHESPCQTVMLRGSVASSQGGSPPSFSSALSMLPCVIRDFICCQLGGVLIETCWFSFLLSNDPLARRLSGEADFRESNWLPNSLNKWADEVHMISTKTGHLCRPHILALLYFEKRKH